MDSTDTSNGAASTSPRMADVPAGEKVITTQQLGEHTSETDVWLSIHGKVYDVTNYLADHPGGMDVMLEHAGQDATEEFEYYGHSDKARQQLAEFLIGDYEMEIGSDEFRDVDKNSTDLLVVAYRGAKKGDALLATQKPAVESSPSPVQRSTASKLFQALLPVLLVLLAVLYGMYSSRPKEGS